MDKALSPLVLCSGDELTGGRKNAKLAAGSARLRLDAGEVHSRLPQLRTEARNQTVDPCVVLAGQRVELRPWPYHGGNARAVSGLRRGESRPVAAARAPKYR
jgi:hypothetical protein